jgi:hypothetical protein
LCHCVRVARIRMARRGATWRTRTTPAFSLTWPPTSRPWLLCGRASTESWHPVRTIHHDQNRGRAFASARYLLAGETQCLLGGRVNNRRQSTDRAHVRHRVSQSSLVSSPPLPHNASVPKPRFAPDQIDRQRRKRPQWTASDIHGIGGSIGPLLAHLCRLARCTKVVCYLRYYRRAGRTAA